MKEHYCSKCKAIIDERVYDYSLENYNKVLCRECQGKNNLDEVLDDKEGRYHENMIKGRIAETLIEELFLSLGYDVFRYGMENTVPGIKKLLKGVKGDVATSIRRMPDFIVKKDKNVFFVEVKFRASEEFSIKDLPEDYPYENAYIIVVSKSHIKCLMYDELRKGERITPTSKNYLGNKEEFGLDKQRIVDFCQFAVKFFQGI
ncbi:MAG: hypothetical protein Q7R96_06625 [Nanoarchaeota archaeon]|nr:hypothetical protein [Nanoarchaeota archaeon]